MTRLLVLLGLVGVVVGCDDPFKPRLSIEDYHRALIGVCHDAITGDSRQWNLSCQRELTALENKGRR